MIVSMKSGLVLTLLLVLAATVKAQEKLTAEDILQRHLDSVGTAAIRSAAKSRVVEATASYRILLAANPAHYDGKAVMVSEGNKLQMLLKINAPQYTGERFKRYGDRTSIEATNVNQTRSELGTLLESDDSPIREGLIGGVLTTGWPLFDMGAHQGKVQYQGLKKIAGPICKWLSITRARTPGLKFRCISILRHFVMCGRFISKTKQRESRQVRL